MPSADDSMVFMHYLDSKITSLLALCIPVVFACDPESKSVGTPEMETAEEEQQADVAACIADNPPLDENAWQGDNDTCPQPPPGDPPVECPDVRDQVVASCASEGVSCDPDEFIIRDAALCLAELAELAPGLLDWEASLVFHFGPVRPVWNVNNTTVVGNPECNREGDTLMFDAVTGELLSAGNYAFFCP